MLQRISILLLVLAAACTNGRKDQLPDTTNMPAEKPLHLIRIDKPTSGSLFTAGESIGITIKLTDTIQPDSIILYRNSERIQKISDLSFTLQTESGKPGTMHLNAIAWKDGRRQTASISVKLKSSTKPANFSYRILKAYPHDPEAYTQGLFYHNGYLYEGTGQQGTSSLRKVEIETGKILQSVNLSREYFGEGIAMLDDKIYQLTWTNRTCFVYDAATFKLLNTFSYNTQGWGLTTIGNELVMSDGSNTIYFIEPNGFSELRRIEVFDNNGPVKMLNELEYIDGKIYANVYQTDRIIIINPETGIVEGNIDMQGLLTTAQRTGKEDVLNGIAYDPVGKRIFVTGKLWNKLFQVEFIKKK